MQTKTIKTYKLMELSTIPRELAFMRWIENRENNYAELVADEEEGLLEKKIKEFMLFCKKNDCKFSSNGAEIFSLRKG